jgi:hypothetical protein
LDGTYQLKINLGSFERYLKSLENKSND